MTPPAFASRRRGFTVLEMLVVCAIILILIALTIGASLRMAEAANKRNTWRTLTKLELTMQQHWSAVVSQAQVEAIPDAVVQMAGGNYQRARVLYIKLRLRQEFPVSFAEALNPTPLPPLPSYQAALASAPAAPPEVQAAACLWLAFRQQRNGVVFKPDTELAGSEVASLTPSLQYITDGWRGPITLYRWPTGSPTFNPGGKPQAGTNDSLDPTGLLSDPAWVNSAGGQQFAGLCHSVAAGASYRLDNPVIASPGPDGKFGLDATMAVTDPVAAADNVYGYQVAAAVGK